MCIRDRLLGVLSVLFQRWKQHTHSTHKHLRTKTRHIQTNGNMQTYKNTRKQNLNKQRQFESDILSEHVTQHTEQWLFQTTPSSKMDRTDSAPSRYLGQ